VTHKWTFGDGATASAANVNHTYAVAGNYSVRDQVVNNDGSVSGKIRTVTVTPGQLIGNPGFETGTASPWSMTTGVLQNNATLAHGGNWFAEIGNGGTGAHTDHVDQSVTIPSGYSSATLTFYLHTTTTETTTTKADDVLYVRIYNASGTLLATPVTYSNLNATSGYVQETVDMTPYIGQKVQIDFVGVNNATLETTWDLDDTSLTVQ
jgi:PKD repeat protein